MAAVKALQGTPEYQALKACHMYLIHTIPTEEVANQLLEMDVASVDILIGKELSILPCDKAKNEKILLQVYSGTLVDFYKFLTVLSNGKCNASNQQPAKRLKEELKKRGVNIDKGKKDPISNMRDEPSEVFVWGNSKSFLLNDTMDNEVQNVTEPKRNKILEDLYPSIIVCGYDCLFVLSATGAVYSCGCGDNGRLGLGNFENIASPRQISRLAAFSVTQVAIHPGGSHAMALISGGQVYSWGSGEHGQLGHGNTSEYPEPSLVDELKSREIVKISCGTMHSVAVSSDGKIYSWGNGITGAVGHGNNHMQTVPKKVMSLNGCFVSNVACGDCYTLAVANEDVWSWGYGTNGELGHGDSKSYFSPKRIENLTFKDIKSVNCGYATSLAINSGGKVWGWGCSYRFRLGLGNEKKFTKPKQLQGDLKGKKIVQTAIGLDHCMAVDENGQVYVWGGNGCGQQGNGIGQDNKLPKCCTLLQGSKISGIACGNALSIAWT